MHARPATVQLTPTAMATGSMLPPTGIRSGNCPRLLPPGLVTPPRPPARSLLLVGPLDPGVFEDFALGRHADLHLLLVGRFQDDLVGGEFLVLPLHFRLLHDLLERGL